MLVKWVTCFIGALLFIAGASAADLSPGEGVYLKYCAACHGKQGNGQGRAGRSLSPPPRDFTAFKSKSELNEKRMIASVAHGRPGTAMVPWDGLLTTAEIKAVVGFIDQNFMQMDERLQAGRALYTKNCSPCHGDDGNSARWTKNSLNPPPRNFTTARAQRELSRERMIESVTLGRPGTAMMAFSSRFDTDEIAAVVDFIRASFMGKGLNNTAKKAAGQQGNQLTKGFDVSGHLAGVGKADMSMMFPKGLQGDFNKGRHVFMTNCFTCHGKDGNGRGPRAKFIFPKPRNFHSQESKRYLNRPALFVAISRGKPGTVMPAWGKVLEDQQIADVAEFVFQAFIQEQGAAISTEVDGTLGWKKKQP